MNRPTTKNPAVADCYDHEVAVRGKYANSFVFQTLVGSDCHDLAIVLRNHDAAVEGAFLEVVAPGDETVDDLLDLIEPRCPLSPG